MTVQLETTDKLSPIERLEALCDPGSLHVIRSEVHSARMGDRARPGDGVIGAAGVVALVLVGGILAARSNSED